MIGINLFRYNPFYSWSRYLHLKIRKRMEYPQSNLKKKVSIKNYGDLEIFLEISLLNKKRIPKRGAAIFRIVFYSSKIPPETIIRRTKYTLPFFSGLPGFCTKQFMVNREKSIFSGRYEWESIDSAQKYANSFAVKFMKRRSSPMPIYYEISDSATGKVVETKTISGV